MSNKKALGAVFCSVAVVVGYLAKDLANGTAEYQLRSSPVMVEKLTGYWEGCLTKEYPDTGGLKTIGIGHLCQKGEKFGVLTLPEIAKILNKDLATAEQCVNDNFNGKQLKQEHFESLVDFTFNVGCKKATVNSSGKMTTIRRLALTQRYTAMCNAFLDWNKGRNLKGELVVIKGLHNRRVAEQKWCLQ